MATQTDFQKVVDFNTRFDVKLHSLPQLDIFTQEPDNVEFCLKLIREEIKELKKAIIESDYIEVIDALADIIYVVNGMFARIGANGDSVFDTVVSYESLSNNNFNIKKFNTEKCEISFQKVVNLLESFTEIDKIPKYLSWASLEIAFSITNHLAELEKSVKEQNYGKVIKNLGYILFFCYKMSASLGTDMDKAFTLVHDNNMTKLCDTEDEGKQSVNYYKEATDDKGKILYDSPAYRLAPDQEHWIVFNKSTKKILKSIKYVKVDLKLLYKQI